MKTNFLTASFSRSGVLLLGLCTMLGFSSPVAQAWDTNFIRASVNIPATISNGLQVTHAAVISRGGAAAQNRFAQLDGYAWAGRAGMDALMVVSNLLVFSFDCDFKEAGTTYMDEDLVAYDPATQIFSLFFDGSTILPAAADIDAATRYTEDSFFLFSLEAPANISGVGWADNKDVLFYDGMSVSRLYSGTTDLGIPQRCNLDALHYENGRIYFSLDTDTLINGVRGRDKDVWVYDPSAPTTTLAVTSFFIPPHADLTALDYPTDTDGDWLSDFEEASGLDEIATTFPGTTAPLSPDGHLTVAGNPDSDGDHMSDGQEAACGTDPNSATDYLHLTSVRTVGESVVIQWATVPGKMYDLSIGSTPAANDYVFQSYLYAEGTVISVTNEFPNATDFYSAQLQF